MAPLPGFSSELLILSAHSSLQTSDPTKMHKHNTKAVILATQCNLISELFRRQTRFFSPMTPLSFLACPAPPQKLYSKSIQES